MSEGLEALHQISLIKFVRKDKTPFYINLNECFKEYFDIMEKELKALNVFKELKFFDVRCDRENGKMIYLLVWNAVSICRISKEQYDSLKEVLL